jgi:hypothetical protein
VTSYLVGRGSRRADDSTKGKPRKRQRSMSRASRRAEPLAYDTPRLGASNGLITQLSEDHRALRKTSLAILEPRPTKEGAAPPSSAGLTLY